MGANDPEKEEENLEAGSPSSAMIDRHDPDSGQR